MRVMATETMTASEAREAARWFREKATNIDADVATRAYYASTLHPDDPRPDLARDTALAARYRRAAVALDAYADGLDAPEFRPTSSDTNRLHRIRARLLDLVPLDGTMSLADDVQRLDRALADARLSALFEAWCCVPACVCHESWTSRGRHSTECAAWIADDIAALAKELTDGR